MIKLIDVEKSFGNNKVLRGVNLEINDGETLVIIGRSGCGKSVMLKTIIGLLEPDAGEIIVEGKIINLLSKRELYEVRKKFGFLFQGAALFDSMTVGENVGLALTENTNMSKADIKNIVAEKLEIVGLPGIEEMNPADLSGGMKKRVSLARSLSTNPSYILYDEPTTGLDPVMSDQIDDLIKELAEKLKVTSVVVTHDIFSVYDVAQRVAMMHEGKIYFDGSPKDLVESNDELIVGFLNRTRKENDFN
ncbi:MAG: ABC transporter ATP-binding protein [Ignavibacteriaceae bacterium]|nr:MAG: ABC transporter ATP-binding protein [Chlorobiota bacterium]MBV6398969.1 putative ribonucleotide transport ATP-binding protein mkl [Ignavibacteria bacterium]MCC6886193.1 ABC transporter ATP-binding protein [Ignavibacteriales bacterium]MCE7953877.1 ABC transporter ATP-binding protein [Chlorobi bacterium CHB7]MDL1887808.1 ABC transporter ATP-binding protein [Ignavibacteria bacterium CHB1]MEB2328842.1 ABC transporter ATP-binding protein [Ignavibacteriaceae bacterium]RIK47895.1 MAG: ABC tr